MVYAPLQLIGEFFKKLSTWGGLLAGGVHAPQRPRKNRGKAHPTGIRQHEHGCCHRNTTHYGSTTPDSYSQRSTNHKCSHASWLQPKNHRPHSVKCKLPPPAGMCLRICPGGTHGLLSPYLPDCKAHADIQRCPHGGKYPPWRSPDRFYQCCIKPGN